jgi:hypothetical protein
MAAPQHCHRKICGQQDCSQLNFRCAQYAICNFPKLKIALNTQNAIACSQNHAISRNTQLNAALMGNRIKNNTPLILDFQHSV